MKKHLMALLAALISFAAAECLPLNGAAMSAEDDDLIVVSLGDSYSSGEGILPFYSQEKDTSEKVADLDWLSHRSRGSWIGTLVVGNDRPLSESRNSRWFFAAATGAKTSHISRDQQARVYSYEGYSGTAYLPKQLSVITDNGLQGKVDYVTLTIGGNDIGFPKLIKNTIMHSSAAFQKDIEALWKDFNAADGIRDDIKACYYDIAEAVGPQAAIIVAGYPPLLDSDGIPFSARSGFISVSAENCKLLNEAAAEFNKRLSEIVEECQHDGMNIRFVDVADSFAGHEAFTDDPYIFPIRAVSGSQDIDDSNMVNQSTLHPNEKGAAVYAAAVQAVIDSDGNGKPVNACEVSLSDGYNAAVSFADCDDRVRSAEFSAGDTVTVSVSPISDIIAETSNPVWTVSSGEVSYECETSSDGTTVTFTMPENSVTVSCGYSLHKSMVVGSSLSLGGDIGVNIYVLPDAETAKGGYAAVMGPNDKTPHRFEFADMPLTANGYRVGSSVYLSQQDGEVRVRLYDADGKAQTLYTIGGKKLGGSYTASVEKYIEHIKADSGSFDPKLTELADALKYVGACTQQYLGIEDAVNTAPADIADVTSADVEKYRAVSSGSKPDGFSYIGIAPVLKGGTAIRLYYTAPPDKLPTVTINGMTLESVKCGDSFYVEIPAVNCRELDKVCTVCFDSFKVRVSALSYVWSVLDKYGSTDEEHELTALCKALYNYSQKADAYFAK